MPQMEGLISQPFHGPLFVLFYTHIDYKFLRYLKSYDLNISQQLPHNAQARHECSASAAKVMYNEINDTSLA